jgi:hypothetical protein
LSALIDALALAIGGTDAAAAKNMAEVLATAARKRVGRMKGLDFNRERVTFSLTAGKKVYALGVDIKAKHGAIWNIQDMWRTDTPGWEVEIVGLDEFNAYARGGTAAGAPSVATVYGAPDARILEVYPSPNSALSLSATVMLSITKETDIPDRYDDVVLTVALTLWNGMKNPAIAAELMRAGLRDMQADGIAAWTGSRIEARDVFGQPGGGSKHDSGNLA